MHQAIAIVDSQMPQSAQTQRPHPPLRDYEHGEIGKGCLPAVQQVKADAAPIRIEDRIGQQVVEINHVGARNDDACADPMLAPHERRDENRPDPVRAVMQQGLGGLYASIQSAKKL